MAFLSDVRQPELGVFTHGCGDDLSKKLGKTTDHFRFTFVAQKRLRSLRYV